ncbi:MAG: FtsX-like permease family protein, partial [Dehalococcoidia bacterium]
MTTIAVLIARRVAGNWRLMSALALGFVIAVGLMSATVIYADALDDLGLDFALDRSSDDDLNIVVRTSGRISRVEVDHLAEITEAEFDSNVARFMRDRIRSLRSGTFFPAPAGTPVDLEDELRPRAFLQSREDILEHVTIEGAAPSGYATLTNIEAAVGRPAAERLGIQVGDQFDLYPFWNEDAPPLVVTVVGIYEQTDPTSDYWTAAEGSFDFVTSRWTTYAFFVDEGALIDDIGSGYQNMPGEYVLVGLLDRGSFGATQTSDVRGSIASYDSFIGDRIANIRLESALPEVLADFEARLFFSRIPLFILIIQIVGIALYYLVMVASMLVDRQAGEIALLKSRGGTTTQVMLVYLVEGLALCAVALALGPLLASVAVAQMGRTPIFDDLSGGSPLEAALTPQAYAVAAGGAVLALAALLIPAFFATRRTIVHYKQSLGRKDQQPIFFRYYFDLFFVALLGLLFFQLRQQGTLATENLFGDLESDPLLLVSPAIFLITAGVLFLRLFPLLLRGISFAFSRTQLTTPLVALWHLVRNPTHYGRLVLLLILATSLGAFAAGFGSTLNTNYGD